MTEEHYATFKHEMLLMLGKRHWTALLGEGKGLTVLSLLYTGLRGSDCAAFLHRLDSLSLEWAKQEQEWAKQEQAYIDDPTSAIYQPLSSEDDAYNALRRDFVALALRYKDLKWRRCKTPGLSTALLMSFCLRYDTLLLPMFELGALALITETSFRSVADWKLWLYQGLACAQCYTSSGLLLCGVCRRIYYCSPQCQRQHRERHKSQCKFDQ